jgi:predicted amidohydrolase YtcJ
MAATPAAVTIPLTALVVLGGTASRAAEPADLVLRGGTVLTCDADNSAAQALAVRNGRILAVGSDADVVPLIGRDTRVIDLAGRTAIPGFIEGHGHLLSLGRLRMDVDLTRAQTWDEVVSLVAAAAKRAPPGDWVVGRGWHQEKWSAPAQASGDRYPHHRSLSAATPDNPVLLIHGTGHACIANAAAMTLAGVDRSTPHPPGGEILRDADGNPTGVFRETAQSRIHAAHERWLNQRSPDQRRADERRAFELAQQECLAKGITSFHDAGSSFTDVDLYRVLADEGKLQLRLYVMLRADPDDLAAKLPEYRMIDHADGRLTVRAIKCMADGALGSHGALLLEPYADKPDSTGLRVQPLDEIRATALLALQHEFQLCTHAIGDRANREVLDLYDGILRSRQPASSGARLRWRIEHVQHLHPHDIPRFADLGVIASMQANHATSDGPFVVTRLGEERARRGAYAWRSLLDSGARIVNGTDAPVEDVAPLPCLHSAVTRHLADGSTFFPEQCMTRVEALRSYTIDAAYAAFQEHDLGSLEAGKRADVVILSGNPVTVDESRLLQLKIEATMIGGRVLVDSTR